MCAPPLIVQSSAWPPTLHPMAYFVTVVSAPASELSRSSAGEEVSAVLAQPSNVTQSLTVVVAPGKATPAIAPPPYGTVMSAVPWISRMATGEDGLHFVVSSYIAPARLTIAAIWSA